MRAPQPTGFPVLDQPHPLAFAHRGAHEDVPENTMAAFAEAVRLGYRHIETDVQASRDGVAVISHDDALSRLFDAPGRVRDHPWRELSALRTADGHGLARLDAALTAFPRTCFNIDPKTEAAVAPVAEAVARCDAVRRVCIGAFDVGRTLRLRRRLGDGLAWSPSRRGVATLWLSGWSLPMPRPAFPAVQVPTRFHGIPVVTPRFVAAAHRQRVQVHVWTVDEAEAMARLFDIGVDGVMTDRPRRLRQVLRQRGQWPGDRS